MIFDLLGVEAFLRERYGDRVVEDLVAANVKTAPDELTVIELKLIIVPKGKGPKE